MKKDQVTIGKFYVALVSGNLAIVRIVGTSPFGGWDAVNTKTTRSVRIRGAQRLRYEVIRTDRGTWVNIADATDAEKLAHSAKEIT